MAGGAQESSTQLNPGASGDLIRDLVIAVAGVLVKQQVIVAGDPVNADSLQRVTPVGEALTTDMDIRRLLLLQVAHLRALGSLMAANTGDDWPVMVDAALEELQEAHA